jgi:hypothetical protein
MIKSRRMMKWAGPIALMRNKKLCRILVGKPKRNYYEDQDVGGWVLLK